MYSFGKAEVIVKSVMHPKSFILFEGCVIEILQIPSVLKNMSKIYTVSKAHTRYGFDSDSEQLTFCHLFGGLSQKLKVFQ